MPLDSALGSRDTKKKTFTCNCSRSRVTIQKHHLCHEERLSFVKGKEIKDTRERDNSVLDGEKRPEKENTGGTAAQKLQHRLALTSYNFANPGRGLCSFSF